MNRIYIRRLHFWLAPIMVFPILLTLITGSLFQVAVVTGKANDFLWLLEFHRGHFGRINLELIYPFLNAFGLLLLASSGILMWFQSRPRRRG
ncbi:hypothetical protein [Roseofilum capinflatum]|uniref:PepSY domain-containing protein n=1 Tax=Roseofilum capinflatum BLCC-M114 TaxID=3022440 RepID=A0ABT7BA91_9CYAN|nr:hypothetical protein [Roseofilum capinflatum]MDJ1176071.1 PepSY domain-containing protein [Roseofilum capinflatum BLCC-M114]